MTKIVNPFERNLEEGYTAAEKRVCACQSDSLSTWQSANKLGGCMCQCSNKGVDGSSFTKSLAGLHY